MKVPQQEQRSAPRLACEERLFVRIVSSHPNVLLEGKTIHCSTQDLSEGGLRLSLEERVPVGSTLQLWIKVADYPGTFLVNGIIRWVREQSPNVFLSGVELRDDPRDEIRGWERMVADIMRWRSS
ncbi:MAG: PilZ domain-containing protein [Gammaproteobacteria bacterium]